MNRQNTASHLCSMYSTSVYSPSEKKSHKNSKKFKKLNQEYVEEAKALENKNN